MKAPLFLAAAALAGPAYAATPAEWRSKIVYQVITDRFARADNSTTAACNASDRQYCGGSYRGIINRLDYIQNMGFTAVWISPITYNLEGDTGDGTAYHGYWQQDLYRLNENFGTAEDLKALSTAIHDRGMYLMVDIVVNHNAWPGDYTTVDYSKFNPFNSQGDYHSYCEITNYDDQENVEDCWLGSSNVELVDLNTDSSAVISGYNSWITDLVSNYSIDGLRIDTVKHVDKAFWPDFNAAAGVFCTGEIFDGDPAYTCPYQDYLDSVLNYPIYYSLIRAFTSPSGSISDLASMINTVKSTCKDSTLLGTFAENHDVTRFASLTSDLSQARNVLAFVLLHDGIPIVFQGQEQHYAGTGDPDNRAALWLSGYDASAPLARLAASVNQIRNHALYVDAAYLTYKNYPIYSDANTLALRKGFDGAQVVAVLSNRGESGAAYTLNLGSTGWSSGDLVVEVLTCATLTTASDGSVPVPMESGLPRVLYPRDKLSGSGICGL
ncbi:glycoside hydrolase superfamily [Phyllosticta citribraziliensis]|uniref:alpha-amylase n=1 Tax=Phyllosticta citribraziliensis TaxID=989973 RepID=A0ABR1LKP4_9PEZI